MKPIKIETAVDKNGEVTPKHELIVETPRRTNSVTELPVPRTFEHIQPRFASTEFITGPAGTGKTYEVQRRHAADPDGVVVAATTGIAAVNLGPQVTTVHSLLGFRDYNSLVEASEDGKLQRNIRRLVNGGMRELIVDEISMFSAPAMNILYNAVEDVAGRPPYPQIKLTVVGDFCQLPPIPDRDERGREIPETRQYAFESDCWAPHFSEHTTRLTRNWRQGNEDFVRALQAARRGDGREALAHLQRLGVRFEQRLSDDFDGTTLCAHNDQVDHYNRRRLYLLTPEGGACYAVHSTRWRIPQIYQGDRQPSVWKEIPTSFQFKPRAYVMILSNDLRSFNYANGDCGTIVAKTGDEFVVQLRRNGREVNVGKVTRTIITRTSPAGIPDNEIMTLSNQAEYDEMVRTRAEPPRQVVMLREPRPMWIIGWVRYFPLRLAYATSVHKSQGLSLDALQIDLSPRFLTAPAMMYVALSRCRTPEGLTLIGTPEQLVEKTNIDPRVREWL